MMQELSNLLDLLRKQRGFDVQECINAKICLINSYLSQNQLSACVVGVSGGIDSAVTLGLLSQAASYQHSPLKKIVAALMPMFVETGASNQNQSVSKGSRIAEFFKVETTIVDLTSSHQSVVSAVESGTGIQTQPWAAGQLVSYLRTPALYFITSQLTQEGLPAILCGTTNRDEGAYIGFFGKASDGMVDLQIISDLHKSEVYAVAKRLGIPDEFITAEPSGDTFDGLTDYEMIGATYDFIELHALFKTLLTNDQQQQIINQLSSEASKQFENISNKLEIRHRQNAHKYLADSPAIHLDVYERGVPGGWIVRSEARVPEPSPSVVSNLIGNFNFNYESLENLNKLNLGTTKSVEKIEIADAGNSAIQLSNVLSRAECEVLLLEMNAQKKVPVGINGMLAGFNPQSDQMGSDRATTYSPALAEFLWNKISSSIPRIRIMDEFTSTDHYNYPIWNAVGINPVLRFICYRPGGHLIPHFDAGFDFRDGIHHTLMSIIFYLTDCPEEQGGATRFILNKQRYLPASERNHSDWQKLANEQDLLYSFQATAGSVLIFDHRLLHDATKWLGETDRVLLRTDIIFKRCGLQAVKNSQILPPKDIKLWHVLNLPDCTPASKVDEAYKRLSKTASDDLENSAYTAWKILRDPYYSETYRALGSVKDVEFAGFFDDQISPDEINSERLNPDWLTTPLDKIYSNLEKLNITNNFSKPLAILLSTGSFCPLHNGHIEMMEQAKITLEQSGYCVLGGYFSISHDNYVLDKCGKDVPSATHRIYLCDEAIKDSDWLMVDPWEALYNLKSINFTDVIERLSSYLSSHIKTFRPIQVVYVFGGDNARFALTFVNRGQCVCIPRPGYEEVFEEISKHPLVRNNPRIVMACNSVPTTKSASTNARNGDFSDVPPPIQELWTKWNSLDIDSNEVTRKATIFLRNEENWAISNWFGGRNVKELQDAWESFYYGFKTVIQEAFKNTVKPDVPYTLDLKTVTLSEQQAYVNKLGEKFKIISLDPCVSSDYNIGVSRCFNLSTFNCQNNIVERPGWPSIEEQIAKLPGGDYILLDDDAVSGQTLSYVKQLLDNKCNITETIRLCEVVKPSSYHLHSLYPPEKIRDLCDCRDYLFGARDGGLVTLFQGEIFRVPYILPYVRPAARASIPLANEFKFSKSVLELNINFFNSLTSPIKLSEADPSFVKLANYLGFDNDTTLEFICRWHLEKIC